MISLNCTSCKTTLEIDDAFAGGVCRCRHCGTIQTVPAAARKGARPGAPALPTEPRALYKSKTRLAPVTPDTQAADPDPAPHHTRAAAPPSAPVPKEKPSIWLFVFIGGALAGVAIAVVAYMAS